VTTTRLTKLGRSIADQVIVVTGAASGMGRATAHLLADEGASVGLVDRDAERLATVVREITDAGGPAHPVTADVSAPGAPAYAVEEIRNALGPIDGLVNNAGIAPVTGIMSEEFDDNWVVSRTVQPSATRPRIVSHIWPRVRGSSPVVGSSRKISGGRVIRLAARSRRRLIPPENLAIGFSAASSSPNCSSSRVAVALASRDGSP
jgi:NAD(P)-dependent dehydrogenase (short-subunit alcohol dehydrogenase family)